jgi:hypothetical protein
MALNTTSDSFERNLCRPFHGLAGFLHRIPGVPLRSTPGFMPPPAPQARRAFHRSLINPARSTDESGPTLRDEWRQMLLKQRARRLAINIARSGNHY